MLAARSVMKTKVILAIVAIVLVSLASSERPESSPVKGAGASPIHNPSGTKRGLGPVSTEELSRARVIVRRVRVGSPDLDNGPYDRAAFGPAWTDSSTAIWSHNGCRTRDDVLARDLVGERRRDECVVVSGTLHDPYTGRTIEFSKAHAQAVQVDHVVALSYAWQQGARGWSAAKRERLANDPLNLLAVDGPENIRKSDRGPSQWMPPVEDERCAFSVRLAQVAIRYDLPVRQEDEHSMVETCS